MTPHGFTIGMERNGNNENERLYITMRAYGKLTHDDYQCMTPLLEAALAGVPERSVDVLLDVLAFDGWELRAAWDDFKLGLAHGREFRKIALLGTPGWQSTAATLAQWFISGEVKFFTDRQAAMQWLAV